MPIVKSDAKTGFWVAIGVLTAFAVWHIAATRFPALQQPPGI